jgi:hypothetical protein
MSKRGSLLGLNVSEQSEKYMKKTFHLGHPSKIQTRYKPSTESPPVVPGLTCQKQEAADHHSGQKLTDCNKCGKGLTSKDHRINHMESCSQLNLMLILLLRTFLRRIPETPTSRPNTILRLCMKAGNQICTQLTMKLFCQECSS